MNQRNYQVKEVYSAYMIHDGYKNAYDYYGNLIRTLENKNKYKNNQSTARHY